MVMAQPYRQMRRASSGVLGARLVCHWIVLFVVISLTGCFPVMREDEVQDMGTNEHDLFQTKALLVLADANDFSSSLALTIQNVSQSDIQVLDDVSSINVRPANEKDDLNEIHSDFGVDPDAQFVQLARGASITINVLVNHDLAARLGHATLIRVPITYRLSSNDQDRVTMLIFKVSVGNRGGSGGAGARP